jgi:SAM-dependent methyltransferase
MSQAAAVPAARSFTMQQFNRAYDEVIIDNNFFESPSYYHRERLRYRRTIEYIASLQLPHAAHVIEIGGGQIGLLLSRLFNDQCTLGDVSDQYSDAVTRFGMNFVKCDLMHDDLPSSGQYDLVVLCEVIEHIPIPPHIVLAKIRNWIRPGGYLFLTTPNLYRLRNVIRLALGMPVFCNFFYPERGVSLGHPLEYSREHMAWQVETGGYEVQLLERVQLSNTGASMRAKIGRTLLSPLLKLVPRWRDNLVCTALNPDNSRVSRSVTSL